MKPATFLQMKDLFLRYFSKAFSKDFNKKVSLAVGCNVANEPAGGTASSANNKFIRKINRLQKGVCPCLSGKQGPRWIISTICFGSQQNAEEIKKTKTVLNKLQGL